VVVVTVFVVAVVVVVAVVLPVVSTAVMSAPLALRPSTSERPFSTSTVCVNATVSVSGCGFAGAIVCVAFSPAAFSRLRQEPSRSVNAAPMITIETVALFTKTSLHQRDTH
jgi:hypothetical protein